MIVTTKPTDESVNNFIFVEVWKTMDVNYYINLILLVSPRIFS